MHPTHPLPERVFFPWISSLGGCRKFQSVHVAPITASYIAISWGREIVQFCSFPAHRQKAIIYNLLCQTQALSSSAFCLYHQKQGLFCEELWYLATHATDAKSCSLSMKSHSVSASYFSFNSGPPAHHPYWFRSADTHWPPAVFQGICWELGIKRWPWPLASSSSPSSRRGRK